MNTNQVIVTNTQTQLNTGTDQSNDLALNPNYNGSLSSRDLGKVQKHFQKYQSLENDTGVPWKIIAAIDLAVPSIVPAKSIAKTIQKVYEKENKKVPENFDERDAADLVTLAKQQNPKYGAYFDSAYRNFGEISRAFLE